MSPKALAIAARIDSINEEFTQPMAQEILDDISRLISPKEEIQLMARFAAKLIREYVA